MNQEQEERIQGLAQAVLEQVVEILRTGPQPGRRVRLQAERFRPQAWSEVYRDALAWSTDLEEDGRFSLAGVAEILGLEVQALAENLAAICQGGPDQVPGGDTLGTRSPDQGGQGE